MGVRSHQPEVVLSDIQNIAKFLNSNFSIIKTWKLIILSKSKSSRYENLSETILVILELKKVGQLYNKITYYFKISKSFMTTTIIHKEVKQPENLI